MPRKTRLDIAQGHQGALDNCQNTERYGVACIYALSYLPPISPHGSPPFGRIDNHEFYCACATVLVLLSAGYIPTGSFAALPLFSDAALAAVSTRRNLLSAIDRHSCDVILALFVSVDQTQVVIRFCHATNKTERGTYCDVDY